MAADETTEVTMWLARHGQTEWSRNGRHTGTTDLPLLPEGEAAARELADRLDGVDFSLVLTSPMRRARHTAELAGFGHAGVDPDLVEWNYGAYEGLTTVQIRERDPAWTVWTEGVPEGETPDDVARRVDRVIAKARAAGGATLVFGHGHGLRALTARWLGQPVVDGRLYKLDTATVSTLGYERETPVILRWNA
ncbi:MAG TPA: histidine phosphatase family protein [Nocardioidaceae bacterium]|nr:histidine phosphatase family protein [Nocardioidaceae bacterium]